MKQIEWSRASISLIVSLASLGAAALVNWMAALLSATGILLLMLAYREYGDMKETTKETPRKPAECEVCAYWKRHGIVIDHEHHPTVTLPEVKEEEHAKH